MSNLKELDSKYYFSCCRERGNGINYLPCQMKIYQHVDELNDRDGIGNDILGFQILFEKLNLPNAILTRTNNSKNESEIFLTSKPPKIQSDSIHILHYGGAGYPIDYFQNIPGKNSSIS